MIGSKRGYVDLRRVATTTHVAVSFLTKGSSVNKSISTEALNAIIKFSIVRINSSVIYSPKFHPRKGKVLSAAASDTALDSQSGIISQLSPKDTSVGAIPNDRKVGQSYAEKKAIVGKQRTHNRPHTPMAPGCWKL